MVKTAFLLDGLLPTINAQPVQENISNRRGANGGSSLMKKITGITVLRSSGMQQITSNMSIVKRLSNAVTLPW